MLRMTPIASAVLLLLLGIDAHAAEETFDTNFMMGGMKVSGFLIFASMITNPAKANMILTSTSISSGVVSMILLLRIIRMTPVYPRCINASGDKYTSVGQAE